MALLPSFHESVRVKANDPTRHSDPVVGTHHKRDTKRPIETQKKPNASNLLASSIPQPGLDSASMFPLQPQLCQHRWRPLPAVNRQSRRVGIGHQTMLPCHLIVTTPDVMMRLSQRPRRRSASCSGGNEKYCNNAGRSASTHLQRNCSGPPPRRNRQRGSWPGDSDLGERGSARPPAKSTSTDQSSNLVGELWLDSLSLREWLQAYLTREMGHALQATNRSGIPLSDIPAHQPTHIPDVRLPWGHGHVPSSSGSSSSLR